MNRHLILATLITAGLVATSVLGAQSADLAPGIAHFNAGRWADAHAFFAGVTGAQPRHAEAALWLGKTLMAENKSSDAEDWFAKAAAIDPRRSEFQLWLARAIGDQAQHANVLRQPFLARRMKGAVDRAIELDPDNLDARELRWQFYAQAPAIMGGGEGKARDEAAEILRRNRYRGQFIAATAAGRAKDFAAIERALKALVTEYPDSLLPLASYTTFLADRARPAEAFALVDAFQKRRPGDPAAWYHVGRVAAITGQQLDRGESALRKYLTLAPPPANNVPTPSNAHLRLGNIAERRGDKGAARTEYELALTLDARNQMARRALAALK